MGTLWHATGILLRERQASRSCWGGCRRREALAQGHAPSGVAFVRLSTLDGPGGAGGWLTLSLDFSLCPRLFRPLCSTGVGSSGFPPKPAALYTLLHGLLLGEPTRDIVGPHREKDPYPGSGMTPVQEFLPPLSCVTRPRHSVALRLLFVT